MPEMMRPMDEAPQDGTPVLLKDKHGEFIVAQWLSSGRARFRWRACWYGDEMFLHDQYDITDAVEIDPVGWWPLPDE